MRLFIVSQAGEAWEAPPLVLRRSLVIEGQIVTVPLEEGAQEAMRAALAGAFGAVRVALAPWGLTPWDILMPTFHRVVAEAHLKGAST